MAPHARPITKVIVTFDDSRDRFRRVASDWRGMDPLSRYSLATPRIPRCTNSALLSPSESSTALSLFPSIPCRATLWPSRRSSSTAIPATRAMNARILAYAISSAPSRHRVGRAYRWRQAALGLQLCQSKPAW
ncbi:hypothetical protein C8Q76DRAFT_243741 [Earliella scabrosa]|nr:hypothetical protein C8Q76DRAFT_243741 [Earliella scabrosa]